MLVEIAFIVFAAAALGLLVYGLRSRTGILEFPFLMGVVFVCYVLYQAFGMLLHRKSIPTEPFTQSLLMLTLCCLACIVGYRIRPHVSTRPAVQYDPRRLLHGGVLLIIIAWFGYYKLTSLTGGFLSFFSVEAGHTFNWSGLPVRYNFFVALMYPGLTLCLVAHQLRPSRKALLICAFGMILPLAYVIIMGRRNIAAWMGLTLLLHLYFSRRYLPPRVSIVAFLFLAMLAIYVAPEYRRHTQLGADHSEILDISLKEKFSQALKPEKLELKNGVYVIGAFSESGDYGYGSLFYDQLIINFVPRQIFGDKFRSSLMLKDGYKFIDRQTARTMGHFRPFNEFIASYAELYSQFSYLGCFYFVFLGVIFRNLWVRATTYSSPTCRIIYMNVIVVAIQSVAYSPSFAVAKALMLLLTILPILLWARKPRNERLPASYMLHDVYESQKFQTSGRPLLYPR